MNKIICCSLLAFGLVFAMDAHGKKKDKEDKHKVEMFNQNENIDKKKNKEDKKRKKEEKRQKIKNIEGMTARLELAELDQTEVESSESSSVETGSPEIAKIYDYMERLAKKVDEMNERLTNLEKAANVNVRTSIQSEAIPHQQEALVIDEQPQQAIIQSVPAKPFVPLVQEQTAEEVNPFEADKEKLHTTNL